MLLSLLLMCVLPFSGGLINVGYNADTHKYAHKLTLWIGAHKHTSMSIFETLLKDLGINKITMKVVSSLTGTSCTAEKNIPLPYK